MSRQVTLHGEEGLGPGAKLLTIIEVWEDPTSTTSPHSDLHTNEINQRIVLTDPSTFTGLSKRNVLAHELGHTISRLTATPQEQKENEDASRRAALSRSFLGGVFPEDKALMVKEERTAWDIAKTMFPDITEEQIKPALSTYMEVPEL